MNVILNKGLFTVVLLLQTMNKKNNQFPFVRYSPGNSNLWDKICLRALVNKCINNI